MTDPTENPDSVETDMLRRAALAVRNLISTNPHRNRWAEWVPDYLDRQAEMATPDTSAQQIQAAYERGYDQGRIEATDG